MTIMYLVDFQLRELCEKHKLVEPYEEKMVNPASIDLRLGKQFINISGDRAIYADGLYYGPGQSFETEVLRLELGMPVLATTLEYVRIPSSTFDLSNPNSSWVSRIKGVCAELRLKSSAARKGLDHALAGWIDPGFEGQLTLELHAHRPVELIVGERYVQMIVAPTMGTPEKGYQKTGRYLDQRGPTEAK